MRLEEGTFERCTNQVGGHKPEEGKGKGLLVADGVVLKPLQSKGRGAKERVFYEEVCSSANSAAIAPLVRFLPRFHGVSHIAGDDGHVTEYIRLEDVSAKFRRPCVLDIKMGQRTYGEDASAEKIAYEVAKYPPQTELGFRFTGMHVYDATRGEYRSLGRKYGHGLSVANVIDGFVAYLDNGKGVRRDVIPGILSRLYEIRAWFAEQSVYRFYSSSLLFVYEGDGFSSDVDVRCIDFAHVYPICDGGKDEGYVHGIDRVIRLFASLLDGEGGNVADMAGVVAAQDVVPAAATVLAECA
eukprot:Opistho-2@40447